MADDGKEPMELPPSLSYEPRIVGFLDILGFRSFVSQGHAEAVRRIKAIDDALQHTLECIRGQDEKGWVSIRSFSDCFCLSTKEAHLPTVIDAAAFLQHNLAMSGIFVRGAISTGYHCETSQMIFSQGLVRAYELQRHDSYPRVLIGQEVIARMLSLDYVTPWGSCEPLTSYVLIDEEDICFLDYLQAAVVESEVTGMLDEYLTHHADVIREQLSEQHDNERVIRKHLWLAAYHNHRVDELLSADEWEPQYFAELIRKAKLAVDSRDRAKHMAGPSPRFRRLPGAMGK